MARQGMGDRLKHAWNAFVTPGQNSRSDVFSAYQGPSSSQQPYRTRLSVANGRTIISGIYTRMAIDVAGVEIKHTRVDDENRYLEDISSGLNECLTVKANVDQFARAFRQDIIMTLFERGVVAIVPVDTTLDPRYAGGWDIQTMRVGWVTEWFPYSVRVSLFNEKTQRREEITLPKKTVAIIENPLYAVMNEPNSTLQRLLTKLSQLDSVDEQSSSGKLDLIIQLPYAIKSEARRKQADQRRQDMEAQLKGSKYGIAYSDATEKITQLNRPAENQLMAQVEYLTTMLYGQLGITEEVMNGTADEATMINYRIRTVEPLLDAVTEAMRGTFLTKTACSQGQSILYFIDPFKLVPLSMVADIADKFTRNEIVTSNEVRQGIGMKPSKDKKADQLVNSNMPQADTGVSPPEGAADPLDQVNQMLDEALSGATA